MRCIWAGLALAPALNDQRNVTHHFHAISIYLCINLLFVIIKIVNRRVYLTRSKSVPHIFSHIILILAVIMMMESFFGVLCAVWCLDMLAYVGIASVK